MATTAIEKQLIELKDLVSQLNTTISSQTTVIQSQADTIKSQSNTISELKEQIEYFKKKLFGSSSEKSKDLYNIPGQISLFDDMDIPAVEIEPEMVEISFTRPRKSKKTLEDQFGNISTEKRYIGELSDEDKFCPACGTELTPIGEEYVRTEIKYTRAKLLKIEYYTKNYGCPKCKDTEEPQFAKTIVPPALIPGSYISESLAAYIINQKYVMSVPLYRLEQDFKQFDALITRATMARAVIACSQNYFKPMYDYFHRQLLKRRFIMMDESPVQVLKEPDKRPESKSYFWITRTGEDGLPPIVLYKYTETRAGENAKDFLKGIEPGFYLMADGFSGYNKLPEAKRCCCYAHIRRYFVEAIPKGHEKDFTDPAVQGMLYCNKLFEYERSYKEKGLSFTQRQGRRLKDEKPVIEAFLSWAKALALKTSGNGKLAKALNYVINRERDMFTYLEDGRCSLSNNFSENAVRPITVGRKNWLFSDSQDGAEASMICYTIIEMAKIYNLKIYDYIRFLLEQRPSANDSDETLEKIAPWNPQVIEQFKLQG